MGLLDFLRRRSGPPPTMDIPLFPLNTVLFPGGVLPLKIFEQRYLDMAAECMKENAPFGVCLIMEGNETGAPAEPHDTGTLAEIDAWEMEQLGILLVRTRGGRRFRILERHMDETTRLQRAHVELLPAMEGVPVPESAQRLLPLLRRVVVDAGRERIPEPHRFDDAEWVSSRLIEILPVQNLAKQKLLELDNPLVRLEILEKYLDQKKLLD